MLYFSEIRGKSVQTEDGIIIGKLDDLIFLAQDTPRITKMVVRDIVNKNWYVPIECLKQIDTTITIQKSFISSDMGINELFVLRNVLDKQIIDLKGHKVVRVNDVAIQDKPTLSIAGVDIGVLGILRRLNLEKVFQKVDFLKILKTPEKILSWADIQPLELTRGKVILNVGQEKLKSQHPADLASYLETTNIRNIGKVLSLLDKEFASKVITELNPNFQLSYIRRISIEKAAKILSFMDSDEAVDVLSQMSNRRQLLLLDLIDKSKKPEIEKLLKLNNTPIGPYLNTEYVTVNADDTSSVIIQKIREQTKELSTLDYIYVINEEKKLIGVFNLHELLLQSADTPAYKFMINNVIIAHLQSARSIVMRRLVKYKLYALPVIDDNRKIVGVVKRDDIGEDYIDRID